MSEVLPLALALAAGLGLGLVHFGGLWLTVRRLPTTQWPVLMTLGSFMGRTAMTLFGFYLVMAGAWERLLACLVGFLAMRFLIVSWLPSDDAENSPRRKEEPA